ncbi:MAG: hypothetical protein H6Q80_1093 [Deltaproteobacteria bacterium]|nr:hypothetical protein [Deltaproteobacteria bacterium]
MNPAEFSALLHAIDQMIQISGPRQAEYYRGYRLGIQFCRLGTLEESIHEHYRLNESYAASGDHYVDSYARGYRDGCKGVTPEP